MRGIVPDDILDALKKKKLGLPGIDIEVSEDRNAMQMGEFEVIKELLAAFPAAKVAKAQVTIIILVVVICFIIDPVVDFYTVSSASLSSTPSRLTSWLTWPPCPPAAPEWRTSASASSSPR